MITRGADEAIDLLVRAFCTAGQDGIVICPPTFPMYAISAQIQNAAVHEVALLARDGFQLDVDGILAARRDHPRIKLVFLCTPNNPTGNLLHRDHILALCRELLGRALIVPDQTYVEYSGQTPLSSELDAHPDLVVLRTLSKVYSLAGERIGIAIAHPDATSTLARILAPYPLAQSAIATVTAAITPEGIDTAHANIRRILAERDRVQVALTRLSDIEVFPSDANYLLVKVAEPKLLVQHLMQSATPTRTPGVSVTFRSSVRPRAGSRGRCCIPATKWPPHPDCARAVPCPGRSEGADRHSRGVGIVRLDAVPAKLDCGVGAAAQGDEHRNRCHVGVAQRSCDATVHRDSS